jgi:hypothetical protein
VWLDAARGTKTPEKLPWEMVGVDQQKESPPVLEGRPQDQLHPLRTGLTLLPGQLSLLALGISYSKHYKNN